MRSVVQWSRKPTIRFCSSVSPAVPSSSALYSVQIPHLYIDSTKLDRRRATRQRNPTPPFRSIDAKMQRRWPTFAEAVADSVPCRSFRPFVSLCLVSPSYQAACIGLGARVRVAVHRIELVTKREALVRSEVEEVRWVRCAETKSQLWRLVRPIACGSGRWPRVIRRNDGGC